MSVEDCVIKELFMTLRIKPREIILLSIIRRQHLLPHSVDKLTRNFCRRKVGFTKFAKIGRGGSGWRGDPKLALKNS
jgi:hypothetical protein